MRSECRVVQMRRLEEGLGREADVVGEVGPVNFE
jgi:hypothetical protein